MLYRGVLDQVKHEERSRLWDKIYVGYDYRKWVEEILPGTVNGKPTCIYAVSKTDEIGATQPDILREILIYINLVSQCLSSMDS